MARHTRFPVEAFERGQLPEVCILSGEPTGDRMKLEVSNRPGVAWLLIFGILPYVIANSIMTRSATGWVPMTEEVHLAVKAGQRAPAPYYVAGLVTGVVGLLLSLRTSAGLVLILLGIIVVLGAWIYGRSKDPLRDLQLDKSGRWVELPNAADRFADAVTTSLSTGAI